MSIIVFTPENFRKFLKTGTIIIRCDVNEVFHLERHHHVHVEMVSMQKDGKGLWVSYTDKPHEEAQARLALDVKVICDPGHLAHRAARPDEIKGGDSVIYGRWCMGHSHWLTDVDAQVAYQYHAATGRNFRIPLHVPVLQQAFGAIRAMMTSTMHQFHEAEYASVFDTMFRRYQGFLSEQSRQMRIIL